MRLFNEQRKMADGDSLQSPIVFAEIVAVDEENRLLKINVQPWDFETGWCKVLKDTFYPIPTHATHIPHNDPQGGSLPHDAHTPHDPQWPYTVGQEVLAAVVQGSNGSEQYVVLGLIDMGAVSEQ